MSKERLRKSIKFSVTTLNSDNSLYINRCQSTKNCIIKNEEFNNSNDISINNSSKKISNNNYNNIYNNYNNSGNKKIFNLDIQQSNDNNNNNNPYTYINNYDNNNNYNFTGNISVKEFTKNKSEKDLDNSQSPNRSTREINMSANRIIKQK
jgi:hypothetical protein